MVCETCFDPKHFDKQTCPACGDVWPSSRSPGCYGEWSWLKGRKLSLGKVIDVCDETATVRSGDDDFRILISELLAEDFKAQDKVASAMSEALNSGDGSYSP